MGDRIYTTTSRGDEQTITSSRSTSNNDGTNNTSSSSSDTVRTRNSQTVTVYKDGLKNENESSSYERWWSDKSTEKGQTATTNGYESWSSSYSKSEFKGGYSWSETISGTNSESVTKGGVTTSKRSDWSWTRSGTVWDDGRNNWSESWSKSNLENGKYLPGESETTRGSYNPKGTGTQTDNAPSSGEPPRLTKPPKNILELNKQPKEKPQPSQKFYELPIAYTPDPKKFSGDFFAGNPSPRKPTFKEQIEKLLRAGAIANYNRIVELIMKASQVDRRTITQDSAMMRLIGNSFGSKPELSIPIVASLLKGEQRWSNPGNDFTTHFQQNTEKALSYNATMNCWEMILYAAFLCAQITGSQIEKFMNSTYPGREMKTMGFSNDLPFYPGRAPNDSSKTKYPQPGDLVYFRHFTPFPGHVAVSLFGSLVVSLWEQPNLGDGNKNRIQIIDIKDLPGQVLIGPPLTQAIKDGNI